MSTSHCLSYFCFQIFVVLAGGHLTLQAVNLSNGNASIGTDAGSQSGTSAALGLGPTGGAVHVSGAPTANRTDASQGAFFTAISVTFQNNAAAAGGGAVFADSFSSVFIRGALFIGNSAGSYGTNVTAGGGAAGGALLVEGAKGNDTTQQPCVTVTDSVFEENSAYYGGAVAIVGSFPPFEVASLTLHWSWPLIP